MAQKSRNEMGRNLQLATRHQIHKHVQSIVIVERVLQLDHKRRVHLRVVKSAKDESRKQNKT